MVVHLALFGVLGALIKVFIYVLLIVCFRKISLLLSFPHIFLSSRDSSILLIIILLTLSA